MKFVAQVAFIVASLAGCAEESWHYSCRQVERCEWLDGSVTDLSTTVELSAQEAAETERTWRDGCKVELEGCDGTAYCATLCDPTDGPTPTAQIEPDHRRPQDDATCAKLDPAMLGFDTPIIGMRCVSVHVIGGDGATCCAPEK